MSLFFSKQGRPSSIFQNPPVYSTPPIAPTPSTPPRLGMFGAGMLSDPNAVRQSIPPGGAQMAQSTAASPNPAVAAELSRGPMLGDPPVLAGSFLTAGGVPGLPNTGVSLDPLKQLSPDAKTQIANAKRRWTFDEPGGWGDRLQMLAASLMSVGGLEASGAQLQQHVWDRQRNAREEERQATLRAQERAWAVEDRDFRANQPDYFSAGRDRVRYDPRTGASSVIYDAPEEFETYATQFGDAGTPEYQTASQDYVLRGNGPTAFGYDADLEGVRQGNRVSLENLRQTNRVGLRQTPTYAATHPRPRTGGGGATRPTVAGVIAPILAKVSRGEQLTPGEQQAYSMYRPGRGGGKGAVAGGGGGQTAPEPKTGKKVRWNGSAWVPAS